MNQEEIQKLEKAGRIASKIREQAKSLIKPQMPLKEIAEKIEFLIIEAGAKPAFPVNLSMNEIAAHYTPPHNDETKAHGLLKVDLGVHLDGFIADTAFSLDLEDSQENKQLIEAASSALQKALNLIQLNTPLRQIGFVINKTVTEKNCQPIINLSGHSIGRYELHAGLTIPNYDNSQEIPLVEGLYAIEPFTTLSTASGSVKDGKPSGIYKIQSETAPVRDSFARQILEHIKEEYQTLPFCSRWLVKKFGTRALLALRQMEQAKILHHYPQLIEKSGSKVAQAEHSVLILKKEKIITTN